MRSADRRATERAGWADLEALLAKVSAGGERALDFDEIERLGARYRHAAAQLAEARQAGWDRRRVAYLDSLVHRAHFVVYPAPRRRTWHPRRLLAGGFARVFRQTLRFQLVAFALFAVGALVGYLATLRHVELAYPLIGAMYPAELVQGLIESPQARSGFMHLGRDSGAGFRSLFAAGLVANNARVAFAVFALGIAAAVPTVLIQTFNGALLGSLAAVFDRAGTNLEWWAWVLPHAVPEVAALCVCAAAGLRLGFTLIHPGPHPRRDALAEVGTGAAALLGFAVLLLAYAAVIEAFFRQSGASVGARLALAVFNALLLAAYLGFAGRGTDGGHASAAA